MKTLRESITLKPESIRLLKPGGAALVLLFLAATLLYSTAGHMLDFQFSMMAAQQLALGLRGGFALLCLGVLFLESGNLRKGDK
ncbi:MAG: hypothetical protein FWE40_00390 [Oscillospiraceae bacterium]|jgi:hypothetical protein|nr:hypothetical protein [Oscillospiraceae bacterium]